MSDNPDINTALQELAQYKEIIEKTNIVSKTDSEGIITFVNDGFVSLSGFSREELIGETHALMRSVNTPQHVFDEMWSTLRGREPWSATVENVRKDGTHYRVDVEIFPIYDAQDVIVEYIGIYHEVPDPVSETRVLEEIDRREELEQHLEYLQNIIDQQNNIVIVSNGDELVMANHQFMEFFSMPSTQSFKDEFGDISNAFVRHDNFFHLGKVTDGGNWVRTLQATDDEKSVVSMVDLRSNEPRALAVKISDLDDGTGYYVISLTDITDLTIKANQYFYEATHDKLTGIFNRSHFSEVLTERCKEAKEGSVELSLLMIGINGFKALNDAHGSDICDGILKNMAETISMNLRMRDQIARWGGAEFALLMPETGEEKAMKMAENIRSAISSMQTYIDDEVTVSIAITVLDESLDSRTFITETYESLSKIRSESGDGVVVV